MAHKKWLAVAVSALAAVAAIPRMATALKAWEAGQRQAAIVAARAALSSGADGVDLTSLLTPDGAPEDPDEGDDAEIRRLAMAAEIGLRPPEAQQYLIDLAAQELAKWADPAAVAAAAAAGATVPGTRKWTSLGPLAARTEFNGSFYRAMDSGRPTAIAVHPGNPYRTFLGTSGGGVWFADLSSNAPSWVPITDNLGVLAIGAIAIDPNFDGATGKVTIWLGLGDAFDQQSGVLVKGTYTPGDAAGVWGPAIALGAAAHPADGFPTAPLNIRQIRIDPTNTSHLLVGTDDGLYASSDGGATFQLTDLPNDASVGKTRESVWDIQYLGSGPTGSQWLLSGVYACPTLPGSTVGTRPPAAQQGSVACANDPVAAHFNKGDFWKSTDGGANWTSIRATSGLPIETQTLATEVGRIAFATGSAAGDPRTTVVYAQASTVQESSINGFTPATSAYLKSVDGGSTWTRIATGLNLASPPTTATAVTNPTTLATEAQSGCTTMNLGHLQSWYNLAVAVDPGDPNRALFGGDLCSAVTVDGGKTFQLASHWLPQGGQGLTKNGFLAYVHADWHVALALRIPGQPALVVAGTDGGVFVTRNVWDVPTPELGSWTQPDVGLATHLFYGIGTGDPTLGNPNVLFGGLQDNGSRWRLVADESFIADFNPGNWDQVVGGDGLGAAVASDTNGQNQVYWISVNGTRRFCVPRAWDCSQATRIQNGVETPNWRNPGSPGVSDPFLIRYDPLGDDSGAVASASNESARLWTVDPVSLLASVRTVVPGPIVVDSTPRTIRGMGLRVSPYRYTIDGVPNSRIYGGVTTSSGATLASTTGFGSFLVVDKPGAGATTFVGPHGVSIPKVTGKGTGTIWIGNGSDFAAPQSPVSLGGTDSKLTWLVSSNAVLSTAVGCAANPVPPTCDPAVLIPESVGHIFKTTDGGNTWTPFHGNGTGGDLPNVPVFVMRYDPSDTTDQTLWVGTEIGVYRTTDGGNTWARYGIGLPAVRVTDIRISNNGSLVRVSTYGRGVWEIYPNSEPAVANGSGDFDRTKVIDFFNLASLAARIGSTPSAVNNLVYDSAVDLDGTSTIDDADVAAVMAKFGSTLP
jgi:hypothetical protein